MTHTCLSSVISHPFHLILYALLILNYLPAPHQISTMPSCHLSGRLGSCYFCISQIFWLQVNETNPSWFRQKRKLLKGHWTAYKIATEAEELGQWLPCWNYPKTEITLQNMSTEVVLLQSPRCGLLCLPWLWGLGAALATWHHCLWKLDLDIPAYSARVVFFGVCLFVLFVPNLMFWHMYLPVQA